MWTQYKIASPPNLPLILVITFLNRAENPKLKNVSWNYSLSQTEIYRLKYMCL